MHAEADEENAMSEVRVAPGLVKEQIAEKFESVVVESVPRPIISKEVREKYLNHFVAFSLSSNLPEWGDAGAAKSRVELSEQMLPRVCGKNYYACPIK
jgi:hypothetical protein